MEDLTQQEIGNFTHAIHCHVCELPFHENKDEERDHSHLTSKYRGAAHHSCHLNYKNSRVIPIIFDNLSGYDGRYLLNDLANSFKGHIDVISLNKEKHISFKKYIDNI